MQFPTSLIPIFLYSQPLASLVNINGFLLGCSFDVVPQAVLKAISTLD